MAGAPRWLSSSSCWALLWSWSGFGCGAEGCSSHRLVGQGAATARGPHAGAHALGAAVVGVLKVPWAITAAASLVVVHHHETGLAVAIAFVLFTVASTATVGLMFLYYARYPGEAQAAGRPAGPRGGRRPAMGAVAGMLVGGFLMIDGGLGLR